MKRFFLILACVSILISTGSSRVVDAGEFETLIDGYGSTNFPVIQLPWLSKEAYLEGVLPRGSQIFSKKKDFRVEGLTVFQRHRPELELYFYKNQLCEVAYFFRRPPSICLENFSECDEFGALLHLIIKKYGPGKTGKNRLVIWPAGYKVERTRLWSVDNIKIGLYKMSSPATSILMAKHMHLNKAVSAAQQKYRKNKATAIKD